jgi:TolB protein
MSPDGTKIVFGSVRYGLGDVVIMKSDGTDWKRLTNTSAYEGEPSFSSDGKKIVFVSERDGNGEIYIMNSDGTDQTRLTTSEDYNSQPSFSPNGMKIVFTRNVLDEGQKRARPQIFIMNKDGTDQKRLTYNNSSSGNPSFSPDGKTIIFTYRKEGADLMGIMDVNGSNIVNLIKNCNCSSPSFSPDGSKIVFQTDWHNKDSMDIYIMDLKDMTSKHVKAKKKGVFFIDNPTFVNNGKKIMFLAVTSEKGGDICTIDLDGSELRAILKNY